MAKKVSPLVIPAVLDTSGIAKGVRDVNTRLKGIRGGSAGSRGFPAGAGGLIGGGGINPHAMGMSAGLAQGFGAALGTSGAAGFQALRQQQQQQQREALRAGASRFFEAGPRTGSRRYGQGRGVTFKQTGGASRETMSNFYAGVDEMNAGITRRNAQRMKMLRSSRLGFGGRLNAIDTATEGGLGPAIGIAAGMFTAAVSRTDKFSEGMQAQFAGRQDAFSQKMSARYAGASETPGGFRRGLEAIQPSGGGRSSLERFGALLERGSEDVTVTAVRAADKLASGFMSGVEGLANMVTGGRYGFAKSIIDLREQSNIMNAKRALQ
jgi:hypothetical protein